MDEAGRTPCPSRARTRGGASVPVTALILLCLLFPIPGLTAGSVPRKSRPKPSISIYRSRLIPKIYKVEHCTDKEHAFRIKNVTRTLGRYGAESIDLEFELLRLVKHISQIKLFVQRCTGQISATSCENFNGWNWATGICEMMTAKHMAWTAFMESARPPVKCPMQAGTYTMYNATADMDWVDKALPGLNIDKYIWLSECHTFDENRKMFSCVKFVAEAKRVRIKDGEGGLLG